MSIIEKALDILDKTKRSADKQEQSEYRSDLAEDEGHSRNNLNFRNLDNDYKPDVIRKDSTDALSKSIRIDLNKLNKMRYLTPDTPNKSMFEQLRHIKMQLLSDVSSNKSGKNISNIFMVTSSVAGEGKTYTSLNLALSIAYDYNHTVLYIDGDITRRTATRLLDLDSYQGLTDYLESDDKKLSEFLLSTNIPKFNVLPSGTPHEMKTELFLSKKMTELMAELSSRYSDRIIIMDTPPVLEDTSATALIKNTDKIILIIEAEKTPVHIIKKAVDLIQIGKPVLAILNKSNQRIHSGYGYYNY